MCRGSKGIALFILNFDTGEKDLTTCWVGGWVGLKASLGILEKKETVLFLLEFDQLCYSSFVINKTIDI
jgi:hypothetical protein